MSVAPLEYISKLERLSAERRLHFFELLAHNLTVAVRAVWSEPSLSLEDQVDSLKKINECLHRVTARVWVQRLNTHEWTDESFLGLLAEADASLHPKVRGSISVALATSYAVVAN
jgi:hypothetical protein